MGVITTADENLLNAKNKIKEAYESLLIALDDNTWGSSDYNEEYIDTIQKITLKLMKYYKKI